MSANFCQIEVKVAHEKKQTRYGPFTSKSEAEKHLRKSGWGYHPNWGWEAVNVSGRHMTATIVDFLCEPRKSLPRNSYP